MTFTILVMRSAGSWGRSVPVRRSMVPFCTLRSQGLVSNSSVRASIPIRYFARSTMARSRCCEKDLRAWSIRSSRRARSVESGCFLEDVVNAGFGVAHDGTISMTHPSAALVGEPAPLPHVLDPISIVTGEPVCITCIREFLFCRECWLCCMRFAAGSRASTRVGLAETGERLLPWCRRDLQQSVTSSTYATTMPSASACSMPASRSWHASQNPVSFRPAPSSRTLCTARSSQCRPHSLTDWAARCSLCCLALG